jgi:hypothetical protein
VDPVVRPIVFAGPSLHGIALPVEREFDLAPPAGCGDILCAASDGRRVIGLIDGVFETGPAVWHQEIMLALSRGCVVLGSSSMGAIRAAECARFGMLGVGRIYQDYETGARTSDADVALVHGPAELDYLPLSLPLVDAEDAIRRMQAEGVLGPESVEKLLRVARATFFKARNWDTLLVAADVSPAHIRAIQRWITTSGPGLKARDARLLLRSLRAASPPGPAPAFHETRYLSKLRRTLQCQV